MARTNITPASIEGLKKGAAMTDPLTPGLSIERLPSGTLKWQYLRRIPAKDRAAQPNARAGEKVKMAGGSYPAMTIASARAWAADLNAMVENGLDPREVARQRQAEAEARAAEEAARIERESITVDEAHRRYMEAVERNDHRVMDDAEKPLKERSKSDKRKLYDCNIAPVIGTRLLHTITEDDLDQIIQGMKAKGKNRLGRPAPVQADRTGAELRVFFGWCCSRRGKLAGIHMSENPAIGTKELKSGKAGYTKRGERWLDERELSLFLRALAEEPVRTHRRALLLLLLTGCRAMELLEAKADEFENGMWVVPSDRSKNHHEHPIMLGPWGRSLMATNTTYVIASTREFYADKPMKSGWPKIIKRVRLRMEALGGRTVAHFTPHDFRRTFRSHIEDHGVDEALAELMMNHTIPGLKGRYQRNRRARSMAVGFQRWEDAVIAMAREAGVAEALECPEPVTTTAELQSMPTRLAA